MTWAIARFVDRARALVSSRPASDQSAGNTGSHGPAPNTAPRLKRAGYGTPEALLTARGMRLHNRDTAAAQRYVERHLCLFRGR